MPSGLRALLYLLTLLYLVLGLILFVVPAKAAGSFAWSVSPMVTMTIGAWCLGNAWGGFVAVKRSQWASALGVTVYFTCFGLLQAAVLFQFHQRLALGHPLAWLYVLALAVNCVFAVAAIVAWLRGGSAVVVPVGRPFSILESGLTVVFILVVSFLGLYGLLATPGMRGLNATIFPEVLSPFTLRSFGAFYLSIALGVVPLLITRGVGNLLNHGYASYGALVFITVAALAFIGRFDFAHRPTQFIYIGIYVLVGAVVGVYLLRYGTGRDQKPRIAGHP